MQRTIRSLAAVAFAGVLAFAVPLAHAASQLVVGTTVWIGYAPLYVAVDQNLFKPHGITVDLKNFSDGSLMPGAVAGKTLDLATVTYDMLAGQVDQGLALKAVFPIDYSNGGDAMLVDKSVKSMSDLKGKTVAFNELSPSEVLLAYLLQREGMSMSDIKPVNVPAEQVGVALLSGAAAAGVTYEPHITEVLKKDKDKRFIVNHSSKEVPGLISDFFIASTDGIAKRRADFEAFFKGYLDGVAAMKKSPAKAIKSIAKQMGVTEAEVKEQLALVKIVEGAELKAMMTDGGSAVSIYKTAPLIIDTMKAKGQLKSPVVIADTVDPSFVQGF